MATVATPVNIQIARGAAAERLLGDASFVAQWDALWRACPWATPFESSGFARTWYAVYRTRWEPLLALSRDEHGRLDGLLLLAVSRDGRELVHAGAHQAEYQTWLALTHTSDGFMSAAVARLRYDVPQATLSLQYLPPETPLGWLTNREARRTCLLRSHKRPLMRFGNGADVYASLNKRSNKSRLKRLGKVGKVDFAQLNDAARFDALKDDVILFHDARHLAVNGVSPFANDPLKWQFHVEMMKVPGLLHVTALTCGGRVASFHINTIGHRHVQLSLITHNPLLAEHSPGKLHVLLLGKMLIEQGYDRIDLTPGGDPYKERFANAWDEVYSLSIFGNATEKRCAASLGSVDEFTKRTLTRWNVRPSQAKLMAGRLIQPSALLYTAKSWLSASQEARVYWHPAGMNGWATAGHPIRRDAIDDLMAYQPEAGGPSRHAFLSDAMRRIEDGQHAYTYAEHGRLLHYAWMAHEPSKDLAATALPRIPFPEKCGIIPECYTVPHARCRGLGTASLAAMLRDAACVKDLRGTFITVPAASGCARRLVERAGFRYERSCVRRFNEA